MYRAKCKNNGVEVAIKMVRLDSKSYPYNIVGRLVTPPWSLSIVISV